MSKKLKVIAAASLLTAGVVAGITAPLTMQGFAKTGTSTEVSTTTLSDQTTKLVDETVYVFTKADGSTRKIISSDWTKNLDVDQYTNFRDDEKKTPIELSVSYFLDGEEISAEDLAGKSGKVTVRYEFSNNERAGGYYIPYAVISGMVLDNDGFSNVEAKNAKIINDGTRTIIAGLTLPGMQENLGVSQIELPNYIEFTADTTNFEMDMTVSIATNEVFENIDASSLDSVSALETELNQLTDAMSALLSGSSQLTDGLNELYDKASALPEGVATLAAGSTKLSAGAAKVDAGVDVLKSGIETLYAGINQKLVSQNSALQAGANSTFATLVQNIHDILKLKVAAAVSSRYAADPTLSSAEVLQKGQEAAAQIPDFTTENYDAVMTALSNNQYFADYSSAILEAKSGLDTYRDQFLVGVVAYTDGVASTNENVIKNQILGGITAENGLKAGTAALSAGATDLSDGLSTLNNSTPALIDGISQLKDGSAKLSSGLKQFDEEAVQKLVNFYNGDVKTLVSRIQEIARVAKNHSSATKYIYRTDEIKK